MLAVCHVTHSCNLIGQHSRAMKEVYSWMKKTIPHVGRHLELTENMRRSKRRHRDPVAEGIHYISLSADRPELTAKYINSVKGRGVFSQTYFEKGDFLVEYRGEIISFDECQRRKRIYHAALQVYLFEFKVNGKKYCIDAARDDNSFGRLVNDDHLNPNSRMTRITVKGEPHLCLFAIRQIQPGEEITYNYGDMDWPWREKSDDLALQSPDKVDDSGSVEAAHAATVDYCKVDLQDDVVDVESAYQGEDPNTIIVAHPDVVEFPQTDLKDDVVDVESAYQGEDPNTIIVAHPDVVEFPQTDLKDDVVDVESAYQGEDPNTIIVAHPDVVEFPQTDLKDDVVDVESAYQGEDPNTIIVAHPDVVEFPQTDLKDDVVDVESAYQGEDPNTIILAHPDVVEFPQTDLKDDVVDVESAYQGEDPNTIIVAHPDVVEFPQTDLKDDVVDVESAYQGEDPNTIIVEHPDVVEFPQTDLKVQQIQIQLKLVEYSSSEEETSDTDHVSCSRQIIEDEICHKSDAFEFCNASDDSSTVNAAHPAVLEFTQTDLQNTERSYDEDYVPKLRRTKSIVMTTDIPPITNDLFDTDDSCPDSEEEYVPKSSDESSESSCEISICQSHTNKKRISGKESMTHDGEEGSETHGINREESMAHSDINKQKNTPQNSEREDNIQVFVSAVVKKCDKKRLYDKRQHCLFCKKPFTKISKHLERKHQNEIEVARAVSYPKNSKDRRMQLEYLRKKGNWVHNTEVMRTGKGSLVACKRPNEEANGNEFVHCSFCFGLFTRKVLWRHVKTCGFKPPDVKPRPGKNRVLSLCALTPAPAGITTGLWKVMSHMNQDRVSLAVKGDELIMENGQHLYNRLGSDRAKHEHIRQKMRELGRLILSAREVTSLRSISEMMTPTTFMQTVLAVKHVSGYNQESNTYKIPTLPLKLGQSLAKISELLESKALVNGDAETATEARNFRQVYYAKWNELVSASAYRTLEEGKWNAPLLLPLTEDVKKLHSYLDEKEKEYRDGLSLESSTTNWSKLAQVTLAKVILFNRRREGEVSKMLLSSFSQRDRSKPNDDLNAALSELEQKLCKHFQRLEIRGKRGRKVPVLLTPDMVQSLELLVEKRDECGVEKDNPYLFSRPCAMTYFRGSEYINHFAHTCGAKHPENLSSTKLRKHIGTLSKVLNLSNTELDQLADFLGHDIRIHRQFYRLPEGTLQLAKISKVLMALETGRLCEFKGKSLEDINIDPDERVEDDGQSELHDNSGEQVQDGGHSALDDESEEQVEDGGHSVLDDESEGDGPPLKKQTLAASPLYTCNKSKKGSKGKTETDLKTKRGTRSCKVRRPFMRKMWQAEEIHAVEKHMMNFIKTCRVPGKSDCDTCLKSEPLHLKARDWKAIKFYVKNRIDALKKMK
ncbi:uncharacterized protein LOC121713822 isoform X4 [Alosa sapidissima]|uniref:uncharacterized protein LOC121713822 isoform X4 n=1 Tax=Alosa sapidissima TaxID=34773 RepID=UPI001C086078|nr:uncharacterized protein LOC121713822 isoform X4 [Alosa sapidissima]